MADSLLCTTAEVKAAAGITTTESDSRIDELGSAVAQIVMATYGREFVPQVTATRTFRVDSRLVNLNPYDLRSVTTMKLHPEESSPTTLVANTDYVLLPLGGDSRTGTYAYVKLSSDLTIDSDLVSYFGFAKLEINGSWGVWDSAASVSADLNRAAVQTVLANLDRPVAQIAAIEDFGEGRQSAPSPGRGWAIPFSAHQVFKLYSRNLGVG